VRARVISAVSKCAILTDLQPPKLRVWVLQHSQHSYPFNAALLYADTRTETETEIKMAAQLKSHCDPPTDSARFAHNFLRLLLVVARSLVLRGRSSGIDLYRAPVPITASGRPGLRRTAESGAGSGRRQSNDLLWPARAGEPRSQSAGPEIESNLNRCLTNSECAARDDGSLAGLLARIRRSRIRIRKKLSRSRKVPTERAKIGTRTRTWN